MTPKRWPDGVNVAAGIWLMLSPWTLAFPSDERVLVVTTVLGAALLAAALGAFTLPQAWEKCDEILVGLAAMGSPWMIGLQAQPVLRDSTVVTGALAVLMAALSMIADRKSRAGRLGAGGPSEPASRRSTGTRRAGSNEMPPAASADGSDRTPGAFADRRLD